MRRPIAVTIISIAGALSFAGVPGARAQPDLPDLPLPGGADESLPDDAGNISSSEDGEDGPGGDQADFASGTAKNTFPDGGPNHLSVSAHSDPSGDDPSGHVRAQGDLGFGLLGPFKLEGEVTCLRVSGNRAAIKYRFKHAEGSAEPLEGGGVQIFIEDNGKPEGGDPVDANTFDPPQPAGVFDATAELCDDPRPRAYDPVDSGDYEVHDASS
jgi:hypothetical protein